MYNYDLAKEIKKLLEKTGSYLKETAAKETEVSEKKRKKLEDDFQSIEKRYKEQEKIPEFERAEYDAPTDSELKRQAKNLLSEKFIKEKDKITESIAKAYRDLEENKFEAKDESEKALRSIEQNYGESLKEAKNSAVRQGLARSSVFNENLKAIGEERENLKNLVGEELSSGLLRIDEELKNLEEKKQKAIADFEIVYAAELDNKLQVLQKERAEEIEKIQKYNNSLAEKDAEYKKQMNEDGTSQLIAEEKLKAAKAYFDELPRISAIRELETNEMFKKQLGSYYNYMLNYLKNRK